MIEILSLPRRPKETNVDLSKYKLKSGLPLNSLPGWEHIPLNSKLPMLKCPDNHVIFTKNKIGQAIKNIRPTFDASATDGLPEYNPLQDSSLRAFYANERNLKRLRENGEITKNNDVICNLKDFNEYRQQLHKSQLYYILQELNRREEEQHDRALIANAEYITSRDYQHLTARLHNYQDVSKRRALADEQKRERLRKLWQMKEDKIANIKIKQNMLESTLQHKKLLRQLHMKKHWELSNDLHRRKLISFKKLIQFKTDRLRRNITRLQANRAEKVREKEIISWKKRLMERVENQEKIHQLMKEVDRQRRTFIEEHKSKYKTKWQLIEKEIRTRSQHNRRKFRNKISSEDSAPCQVSGNTAANGTDFQEIFDRLLEGDICKALNTALDLGDNIKVPFDANDPIYKAAQFIMQHILTKLDKDLSNDKEAFQSVCERVDHFFAEAKKFVIFRSTQIISAARESIKQPINNDTNFNNGYSHSFHQRNSTGRVSFNKISSTIGISSYEIHPLIEVKEVGDRRPTPAASIGSLASIIVDSTTSLVQKTQTTHLCRNELIFIEHYLTKFKRDFIVGVGRRVFAAIQCHFENKIMNVRQELLDIDRKFLVKQTTKSILRYAINSLDFESNLRLCISAVSSDVISSLQKVLLRTSRDPRRPIDPRFNCQCFREPLEFCL